MDKRTSPDFQRKSTVGLMNRRAVAGDFSGLGLAPQFPTGRFDRHSAMAGGGFDDDRGPVLLEAVVESLANCARYLPALRRRS